MKTISTLCTLVLFATVVNAQTINETFENYSTTTDLTNKCWSLSGVGLSKTTGITGSSSLFIIPTTSAGSSANSNIGQIITPYINLIAGTSLSFKIKLSNKLSTQATRTIEARLLDFSGIYSSVLVTLTLDKNSSSASAYSVTVPIDAAGIKKVVLDIYGNGDGNSYMFIDDLLYSSTYNYDAPYACGSNGSFSTLPVKFISFTGTVQNNKAQLKWLVDDNQTGDRFEIEKSNDGRNFTVCSIMFSTSKIGNQAYTYNAAVALEGAVYYRIKTVNKDNSISYSNVVYLKTTSGNIIEKITLLNNNQLASLSFSLNSTNIEAAQINLYNAAGVKVYSSDITIQKGINTITQDTNKNLAHGIYVLEVASTTKRIAAKLTK
jgi:hypothetical protein